MDAQRILLLDLSDRAAIVILIQPQTQRISQTNEKTIRVVRFVCGKNSLLLQIDNQVLLWGFILE